jgi:excisionase family DNA binding protein
MKTSRLKKVVTKKTSSVSRERTLKVIEAQELREKLSKLPKSFFIVLDNQKYSLHPKDVKNFIEALIETADLKAARKEGNVLSTQEVADLLNVSRPYVVKLIDSKRLKSFNVGSHRRVLEADALEFKRHMRQEQNNALDELAEETEKLGIEFK